MVFISWKTWFHCSTVVGWALRGPSKPCKHWSQCPPGTLEMGSTVKGTNRGSLRTFLCSHLASHWTPGKKKTEKAGNRAGPEKWRYFTEASETPSMLETQEDQEKGETSFPQEGASHLSYRGLCYVENLLLLVFVGATTSVAKFWWLVSHHPEFCLSAVSWE